MSERPSLPALLRTAEAAARAAGDHALANRARRNEVDARFEHDVKLRLDVECQEKAEAVIRAAWPGDDILGEEGSRPDAGQARLWIIDPIDGTVNFSHGLAHWCSCVAFRLEGEVVAGAVYLPATGECYTATAETAAACNGEPIRVSTIGSPAESMVLTGISRHVRDEASFDVLRTLARGVQKVRVMGSAAADICMVARGRADGYFETGIYLWDWAAAGLIVRQAGGRAEATATDDPVRAGFLCSNGRIHDALRELVTPPGC